MSGNQSDIFGNEIVGKLTLEIYSGLVSDNELGNLEITICHEPVTITNCEVRGRIIINSNSEVEIYNCKLLGIVEPRRNALIMNGPGRNRNASYNIHHNFILGSISISISISIRDQLDLEMRNNTIITDSLYLVPLIDARTDHGSLDISNNILICNGANAGVYDARGPVADEPNIMYNCMLGFEQFSYRNRELDFELDESNLFDVDPLLVELDPLDPHLTADSPCIDAGDPDSPLDPDSTRADIGMFYFHHELQVKPRHEVELPYTELLSVYPNPFNGVSTFAFSLSQPSTVMIDIFNTLGRKQVNLASGNYSTGLHSLS